MNRQEFLRKLEELLEVPADSLAEEVPLEKVDNWDSLNVIGYIALVDENFSKQVDPEKISACKTVGGLIDLAFA